MLDRAVELLGELVAYPTVSSDSNLAITRHAAGLLEECGAQVELIEAPCGTKANLLATFGPMRDGGIVLSGHTDVVPVTDQDWQSDPFVMEERAGRLYGRGTCDMKGFVAAVLAMAPIFARRAGDRPLHVALTYDEEIGCFGAQHLAQELQARGLRPAMAIVGEPTEMRIIDGHKGCHEYITHFHGLEGHGSDPDSGVSAVEAAMRYGAALLKLKEQLRGMAPADCPFEPPFSTVNVGVMQGGTVPNVIASKAQLKWEMRPVQPGDADFVLKRLQTFCDDDLLPQMRSIWPKASVALEVLGEVEGLIPTAQNAARDLVADLTGANGSDLVAFGTEAGIYQSIGMDVVVCGPGSIAQAHKADEYLSLDQLRACLGMLERLSEKLAGG